MRDVIEHLALFAVIRVVAGVAFPNRELYEALGFAMTSHTQECAEHEDPRKAGF